VTSHRADYQRWGNIEPVRVTMKDKYEPVAEPFDGLATYTTSYVRHNQPVRPSMKPDDSAAMSDAPLQVNRHHHRPRRHHFDHKDVNNEQFCPLR